MSHVTAINFEIKDLDALAAACAELGLTFRHGQKTWKWFGRWVNDYSKEDAAYKNGYPPELYGMSEHAIQVPGSGYEIGVCRIPSTGKLTLIYDFYGSNGGKIINAIGKGCEKLRQIYGVHAAMNAHKAKCALLGKMPSMSRSTSTVGGKTLHHLTINA